MGWIVGKIWMKAPDPSRQCCACAGKAGPCSACCTGLEYHLPSEAFDTFGSGLGYLPFPATNCTIAQAPDDFTTIEGKNILLEIPDEGTGPRSNALSFAFRSGDLFDLEIDTEITANQHLAQFAITGNGKYNLVFAYYSGYSTLFYPTSGGKNWGTVVSNTNYPANVFNPNSVLKAVNTGVASTAFQFGPGMLDNIPPPPAVIGNNDLSMFSYADILNRAWTTGLNGFSILSGAATSDYNPVACLACQQPFTRSIYPDSIGTNNTHYCPSGTLFPFVDYASDEEHCESFQVCAGCDEYPIHSQNWAWETPVVIPFVNNYSTFTGFGQTPDVDIQCLTALVERNKSVFEGLTNGNRPLCIIPRLVADDAQNQTWVMGGNNGWPATAPNEWVLNGIQCEEAGPPRGTVQCLWVHWVPTLYYSTNWPYETLPTIDQSQALQVQVTGDKCVNTMVGAGGQITGHSFNYIDQHITGFFYQNTSISLDFTQGSGRLNPIYFHNGTGQVNCPFTSLP